MNTKTLEYIITIAEERSISKAAERFYLSQADLSRHLKRVESDLGAKLFTRHTGGVELTQAGVIFCNDARSILHMEKDLLQGLEAMRHQAGRKIRVMTDEPFYNYFVQTASVRFREMHPDHKLTFESCNYVQARAAILEGKADFGVFYSTASRSADMEYLVFDSTSSYLIFPRDFQGPTNMEGLRSALRDDMAIMLYPAGSTSRMIEEEALIKAGIYPDRILEGNARNRIAYVSQGGVVSILPGIFCTQETRAKVTVGDLVTKSFVVIAYSKNISLSPAMQDLMRIIIDSAPR